VQKLRAETPRWKQLTEKDTHQFIQQGYLVVHEAFQRELAERIIPMVWAELEIDPNDPSTWTEPVVWLRQVLKKEPIPQIHTKRYHEVIDDLCGQGRWYATNNGAGYWPILLPGFAKPPWRPLNKEWHVEGNWFHHRLSSPEQGLVCLQLFTDIEPGGGGTAVRVGSHRYTACILAEAEPDGLTPRELDLRATAATQHLSVVEVTGEAGDIIIMHPFTVHAPSTNTSDRARIAAIKLIRLYEAMILKRQDTVDYSPVELAIVNALGENPNWV
jgi:hypothetical protein